MEIEARDEVNKNSRNPEETKQSDGEEAKKEEFVVDVKGGVNNGRSINSESSKSEKMCRICHFGSEEFELVLLGCDCRGELGFSHLHCAQVWFAQRRDRSCEICGKTAKNIISNSNAEETSILVMELNEMRIVAATLDASRERSRRCKRTLCNILMVCLVVAFVLPWLFRGMNVL